MAGRVLAPPRQVARRPQPPPQRPTSRIQVPGGPPPGGRSNLRQPGQRAFATGQPQPKPRHASGLGGASRIDFSAPAVGQSLLNQKTPFTCIEPNCFRLLSTGSEGTAYYKKNGTGPYCGEHWKDDTVSHQLASGATCSFGARYTEEQIAIMEQIVLKDLPAKIAQHNAHNPRQPVAFTYDLIDATFRQHPKLRCEGKCPNKSCGGAVVVWWPDPRVVFQNIPGVVG